MVANESVTAVIIDSDKRSLEGIKSWLGELGGVAVAGAAADLDTGAELVIKNRPKLVVMQTDADPDKAYGIMGKLIRQFPRLLILATSADGSSDTILKTMRHGAADFLMRPVKQQDLAAAVTKVARHVSFVAPQGAVRDGKVITCFSPKGGMGNTTVATNLAVCLHQATKKQVVLVDLDVEGGDVSMFLNLRPKYSISDATANIDRLDQAFLQSVLARHDSGVLLLAEPQRVEDAAIVSAQEVREVLRILKTMFPYVVLDTEIGYGDRNLAAFDSADMILLTGVLSLPAIKNIQKALDVFERLGYGKDKVGLLINRYVKKGDISVDDAERTLLHKVFRIIPNDYQNVMTAVNRGVPLAALAPKAEVTASFNELARQVSEQLAASGKARAEQ